MQVITNSKGSGDYITIIMDDGEVLFSGHSITARDFVDIINGFGDSAWREGVELVEVTDKEMEEL